MKLKIFSSLFFFPTVVLADGATPIPCAGPEQLSCKEGYVCIYPPGDCGKNQSYGKCEPAVDMCTMEYRPVCGCDGQTYGNACSAKSKHMSIDYDGECKQKT